MMIFYCKYGISKYPEIIECCGDFEYSIGSEKIEYKSETMGNYLNSHSIRYMRNLKIKNANKILFIENKANYIDYIYNKKANDEFVIYHGGMYSPVKGAFFQKIYHVASDKEFYHWSDIDIGGFQIFMRLRKIIPNLLPYKMDKMSFYSKQNYWKKMNAEYKEKLGRMRNNEQYAIFQEVMDEMLKNNAKLEQEAFI